MEVEVGPKTVSWLEYLRRDLKTGGRRVLVERDPEAAEILRDLYKTVEVINGDAGSLGGIADGAVGVILAKDFFGAHGLFPSSVSGQFLPMREDIGNWKVIASEWRRVSREGGKVVVIETTAPAEKEKVLAAFTEVGFSLVEQKLGVDAWDVFEGVRKGKLAQDEGAYALVLENRMGN